MVFLSTIFLLALPLALAPVFLHLFDRRRQVTIEWGAMEFLLEASTRRTSARKLKQWLLLLLRVLAVSALVLALARPKLPGQWFGTGEASEAILIIDNSMSTQRSLEDSTVFARMIERAREEIRSLSGNDRVRILMASPYPVWMTPPNSSVRSDSTDLIDQYLGEVKPTSSSSDLLASLFTAVQADTVDQATSRTVILLTDGQACDWKTTDQSGWLRFQEVLRTAKIPTRLDVIETERRTQEIRNVAVNSMRSSRLVVGSNQTFTLTAEVQNHSAAEVSGGQLVWMIENEEQSTSEIPDLSPGSTHEVIWRNSITRPGVYSLSGRIQNEDGKIPDDLQPDNQATVVVEVREELPVLIVESAPNTGAMQQDSFFVQAALGWINGEPMERHSVFRPSTVTPEELESIELSEFRAVVIPNLTLISEAAVARLRTFAMSGGGVWIALGPRADIEAFNEHIFANGDGLSPLAIEGVVIDGQRSEEDSARGQTISVALREHPATAELADPNRMDTAEVRIRRRFRFMNPPQGEASASLLNVSNGEPLAVEKYLGQGRVIVMGIPLTMRDWSDLARSQAFVVMVQDWLNYLTQPRATRHNLNPGDPIVVHLAETGHSEAFLSTPNGEDTPLTADASPEGAVFRSTRTILPGEYRLKLGLNGESIPFHVQRNPAESNLSELSSVERELLTKTAGLTSGLLSSDLSSEVHQDPVWPALLMGLIALMSIELVLSGMVSRERFGTDSISEVVDAFGDRSTERTDVSLAELTSGKVMKSGSVQQTL